MDYRDNMEIDLIDLALYLLRKWKVLVVCMIIGAVLGGGFGYMRSGVTVSKETGEPVTNSVSEVEALKAKLTDQSAEMVELSASQYLEGMENYRDAVEHGKESIALNVNAYEAVKLTNRYAIDDKSANTDIAFVINEADTASTSVNDAALQSYVLGDVSNIISAYKGELLTTETIQEIKDILDEDISDASVREMISVTREGNAILAVSVYGESEDQVRAIMDVLDKSVDKATQSISAIYDYEIKSASSNVSVGADDYLLGLQNNNASRISTIRSGIATLSSAMTADEKAYFTALIDENSAGLDEDSEGAEDSDPVETVVVRTISKKYVALGLIGGLFLAAFLYAVLYVLSGKLHTSDDLRSAFGLSVIGEVKGDASEFGLMSQGAAIGASKLSSDSVYIMGASDDDISVKVRNTMRKEMTEDHHVKSVKAGSSAVNDAVSMQELSDSDAVVLVEMVGKSRFEDIAREVELCKKFGVKILGAVVVR
ncbi:hypothetical protein [Butyrivibrio sp. XPD2002]|uniref:hypothetical protein n=1 Tax=Butyrivibrio sp. XPD2002 TaxID=1280665 RepID=UPI00040FB759|nr:hypothetical protein [Butyrivibrio sp. XPD2002]